MIVDVRRTVAEQLLVGQAESLRAAHAPPAPLSGTLTTGEYLHRVLAGEERITVETLAALEIACYPEYATGTPGRRPIEFVRLSAANPTPLAARFTALEADARDRGTWWDPDDQVWERQRGIHVELKLAGNELANFSAFLRDDWRANDWMWGRLDAVPTLVDLIVTPESIARGVPDPSERLAAIRQLVTESDDDEIRAIGDELWETYGEAIEEELGSINGEATGPLEQTRLALVARRQWEILAEELPGEGPVQERVIGYRVGAERITDPRFRDEIRRRLQEIIDAASQVLLATASANGIARYGTPDRPTWRGRLVRFAVRRGGRFATRRAIK
jgi:hypothetical protein